MGLQNVSSGRIDAAVFLLTYAIGKIAFRRASGIGWDIGHRFLLGGGSHGLTVVVIRITPLAALDPYNEAAAASFNTVIFSMSLGLIEDMMLNDLLSPETAEIATSPETTGTPSTTYKV